MNILLDADARPVIGHRGNRAHAPENTLESFRQAIALGAASTRAFLGSRIAVGASTADVRRLLAPALLSRPCGPLAFRVMSIPRWFRGVPVPIAALVRATRPEGAVVHVWTINDPHVA